MSEKLFKAGQALTRAYKKVDDFAQKGLITTLKERFKGKTPISTGPVLSKSKELVKFDPKKALPSKLPSAAKKVGKLGKVARIARAATPLALGIEGASLAYKVATLSPEKKAKVKKLKTKLSKTSTKDYHADLLKMSVGGDTMLKNPKKADLDKDGKLSSYEKKRGKAIEANMMKANTGKMMNFKEFVKKESGAQVSENELTDLKKKYLKKIRAAKVGPAQEMKLMGGKLEKMKDLPGGVFTQLKKAGNAKKGKMMYASMGMEAKSTKGYGAARTSGMGLQDEQLVPGKSLDYYKDLM